MELCFILKIVYKVKKEFLIFMGIIEDYIKEGERKFELGDVEGAINDFTEAISLDPKNSEAHNNRGVAKHAKGLYREVIIDYNQAIDVGGREVYIYFNRGNAYNGLRE
jgi:tetratricopeptide (TPR) repeat protein